MATGTHAQGVTILIVLCLAWIIQHLIYGANLWYLTWCLFPPVFRFRILTCTFSVTNLRTFFEISDDVIDCRECLLKYP